MLQSTQFGGKGIPDNAHELNFRFISAQGNLRYYLDGKEFTSSETFAASPTADGTLRMFFNVEELAAILESVHHNELAQKLRQVEDVTYIGITPFLPDDAFPISSLDVEIGWEVNSHTPVRFSTK